jgi:uncharacterized Tic20 family protein
MRYENLERLNNLREKGAITEEEYQREKDRILNTPGTVYSRSDYWGMDLNTYCMFLHLSQLAGFIFPFAGLIMPIVMWSANKDKNPVIDQHGRIVINWVISSVIYVVSFIILCFILIGIPLLIAFFIANIVFVVIGAVRANNGEIWHYPMSINFMNVPRLN